jgi:hypothetical protein
MLGEAASPLMENVSLGRVFLLLGAGPAASVWLLRGVTFATLALSVLVLRRQRDVAVRDTAVELSLFVSLMLAAMPNSWANYQLLLLLPLLVLLARALEEHGPATGPALTALAAYALLLFYAPCEEPSVDWPCAATPAFLGLRPLARPLHDAMVNARFLAPLLLWAACLGLLWGGKANKIAPSG